MNKEEFIKSVNDLGIYINDKQIKMLEQYMEFLKEYNAHTNLTAITENKEIYLKHFYDSLTLFNPKIIDFSKVNTLVDVGTGAGFPGMVLKIIFPHIEVTLIDSNNKKTKFLSELKSILNLDKLNIINERSEIFALNNLDKFDVVTSRAVANLQVLTELCLPMVKKDGYFIALKGNIEEELYNSLNIINTLNGEIKEIKSFSLPIENSLRNIIYIKKKNLTPKGYPRSYDKIKKSLKNKKN